jgi:hypothetical protein
MKPKIITMTFVTLIGLLSVQSYRAFGQTVTVSNSVRNPIPVWTAQPASVRVFPPLETNFERYRTLHGGTAILSLTLPTVSTQLDANTTLQMSPQIMTVYRDPGVPKALAVFLTVSSYASVTSVGPTDLRSVSTFLDFDELSSFRSTLAILAASGVPASPVPEAKAQLSITSKTGTRLEFTDLGGTIRCNIANELDSISITLSSDGIKKMADAFFAARENLDAARDNMR